MHFSWQKISQSNIPVLRDEFSLTAGEGKYQMERSYGGSELGFKSLTFSSFIITCHSLGMGFTTDGGGQGGEDLASDQFEQIGNVMAYSTSAGSRRSSHLPAESPSDTSILIFSPSPSPPPLQMFGQTPPSGHFHSAFPLRTAEKQPGQISDLMEFFCQFSVKLKGSVHPKYK